MKYEVNPSVACDLRQLFDVEPFQQILGMLLRFDEKTQASVLDHLHYMRRAISVGHSDDLTVLLGRLEDGLYYVCVRLETPGGIVRTSWLHEDEIYREREAVADNAEHPVHQILCLTDLYARAQPISEEDFYRRESAQEVTRESGQETANEAAQGMATEAADDAAREANHATGRGMAKAAAPESSREGMQQGLTAE